MDIAIKRRVIATRIVKIEFALALIENTLNRHLDPNYYAHLIQLSYSRTKEEEEYSRNEHNGQEDNNIGIESKFKVLINDHSLIKVMEDLKDKDNILTSEDDHEIRKLWILSRIDYICQCFYYLIKHGGLNHQIDDYLRKCFAMISNILHVPQTNYCTDDLIDYSYHFIDKILYDIYEDELETRNMFTSSFINQKVVIVTLATGHEEECDVHIFNNNKIDDFCVRILQLLVSYIRILSLRSANFKSENMNEKIYFITDTLNTICHKWNCILKNSKDSLDRSNYANSNFIKELIRKFRKLADEVDDQISPMYSVSPPFGIKLEVIKRSIEDISLNLNSIRQKFKNL